MGQCIYLLMLMLGKRDRNRGICVLVQHGLLDIGNVSTTAAEYCSSAEGEGSGGLLKTSKAGSPVQCDNQSADWYIGYVGSLFVSTVHPA